MVLDNTLLVDIGNSTINWRINTVETTIGISDFTTSAIPKHSSAIISCVANKHLIKNFNNPQLIHPQSYKNIVFNYDFKQLGVDRFLAIIAGYELLPNETIVIIDIGTAITIDKLEHNTHISLGISAGLKKIRQSFHFKGSDSKNAWQLGTKEMVRFYLEKVIENNIGSNPDSKILITGGGQSIIDITHKNISYHKNLVLDGLNYFKK